MPLKLSYAHFDASKMVEGGMICIAIIFADWYLG